MTEEARQLLEELEAARRGAAARNIVAIAASLSTVIMAAVVWMTVTQIGREAVEYAQAAQQTVKTACKAAEEKSLPAKTKQDCKAAEENKLPEQLLRVVDDPDPNDPEFQDPERQDSERQEPEIQDPETQDPELPDSETNDPDPTDDPDPDDPETDDPEIQESEIQEPEIQEPEQQNAPVCPDGYVQAPFHYFGPDGVDDTGDEEDWLVCKKVG